MPYIGRAPSASITKLEDADQDTKIQVEESSDEDTIRFDIAGAEDFTMTANTFTASSGSTIAAQALTATSVASTGAISGTTGTFTSTVDINGSELILDANANTSITADTDDQIDFKIAGADDFRMTANSLNILSGSTLTIDSGATITNSGTANNFGTDPESAYAGVLETNANFVDQVIFGPSVDGVPWKGLWNKASLFSSLMLATVEDPGSAAQVNIWDLTEQSSGTISTTPLGTVNISGAATPTSIAACMGYIIVGHEDGMTIIDPHGGSWAERTIGWPKSLSTSTTPALDNNDVKNVVAGFSEQPPYDPRTGGPFPSFGGIFGTGEYMFFLFPDGSYQDGGTATALYGAAIANGRFYFSDTANTLFQSIDIHQGNVNSGYYILKDNSYPYGFMPDNAVSFGSHGGNGAVASADGLSLIIAPVTNINLTGTGNAITRAYNTGYLVGDIRGAWLANSVTADRSYKANTLTQEGSVTEAAVESGCELMGYSGFSSSVTLMRASDADWDEITTGPAYLSCWFKCTGNSAFEHFIGFNKSDGAVEFELGILSGGTIRGKDDGATAQTTVTSTATFDDSAWHKADFVRVSSTERYLYVDGRLVASDTTDAGSLSDDGNLPLGIGANGDATNNPATTSTLSLARLSVTAPTAALIRQMYDAEKGMFVASAECLLQSGTTDAVIDVDVDPLTNKVLVTQTDAITVFDGLVVDSKPTVNSGASEKGKLWGALRTEQNAANAYVTAPAVDQRQVNEMVRGLVNEMPKGVDLSKAKGWLSFDHTGPTIMGSYNVKSVEDVSAGNFKITWAVPFKSEGQSNYQITSLNRNSVFMGGGPWTIEHKIAPFTTYNPGTTTGSDSDDVFVVAFGELENE